jgi:hypothetical protein
MQEMYYIIYLSLFLQLQIPSSVKINSAVSEVKHSGRQDTSLSIQGLLSLNVLYVEKACGAADMT